MPRLALHVGLPKAASSTLQQRYLSRHDEIAYFALPRKGGPPDRGDVVRDFVRSVRDEPGLAAAERLLPQVTERMTAADRKLALFSEERLTGHFGAGVGAKAAFAARSFPGASVILVIRHPRKLLVSNYAQHLRYPRPHLPTVPGLARWLEEGLGSTRGPVHYAEGVSIGNIAEVWTEAFGPRVIPVVFEELVRAPVQAMTRLARRLEVRAEPFVALAATPASAVNAAPRPLAMAVMRRTQTWTGRPRRAASLLVRAAGGLPGTPRPLTPDLSRRIDRHYAGQCDKAARILGLDLARWGYPTAGPAEVWPPPDRWIA